LLQALGEYHKYVAQFVLVFVADNHLENVDIVTDELQLRWHVAVATIDDCVPLGGYPRALERYPRNPVD
jgi:hypothetical protein